MFSCQWQNSPQSNFLWTIFYSHAYHSAYKSGPEPWGISPEKGWVSRRGGAGNFQSYTKSNYWNLSGHFAAQWFSLFEYIFQKTSSWTLEVLHLFCFVCIYFFFVSFLLRSVPVNISMMNYFAKVNVWEIICSKNEV